jgi:hypothetical protein
MRSKIFAVMTLFLPLLPISANAPFYQLKVYGKAEGFITIVNVDLNHDGKPDVVGLNFNRATQLEYVTGALGNGKGGFLAFRDTLITNLNGAQSLSAADFNGDGFPDVVISGSDPVTGVPAIGVMLGNGDGTFQATTVYKSSVAGASGPVVTGDFTGHGKIDVAVPFANTITVFPGKGNGTLGSPVSTTIAVSIECMAAADFNNDGKLDLTSGTAVLLGNGDGTFQSPLPVPGGSCNVAVADLNHDGNLDLVTGNPSSENIRVHLGNGTGKFDAGKTYHTGHTAGAVIQVADFNGDGSPDLAALNRDDDDVTVLLNKGDGTFTVGKTWNIGFGTHSCCASLAVDDFNQDHKPDLAAIVNLGELSVILGNGNGTFQAEFAQNDQKFLQFLNTQIAADVNNDHKEDLVFSGGVVLGNGDGSFRPAIPFPSGFYATTVGNFTSDGKLDVAGPGSNNTGGVSVCLGKGNGTFQNPVVYDQGVQHQFVLAGDFNNDGKLDLAASDQGGISILLGNGDGTFQNAISTALNASFPTFILGDFNNDGKLDVAAITGTTVSVLLGQGNGKFSAPVATSVAARQILAGDMNNDGKLDLVALSDNTVSVWLGNGNGTFKKSASASVSTPRFAVLDNFNLNGNLGVAMASQPFSMTLLAGDGKGDSSRNPATLPGASAPVAAL